LKFDVEGPDLLYDEFHLQDPPAELTTSEVGEIVRSVLMGQVLDYPFLWAVSGSKRNR
jgi:hypothetical protein